MKLKDILLFIVLSIAFAIPTIAQTGIGTTTPNASAKLEVYATNKGFLPPRVTLTSATDATTIASPAEGLLVYNLGSVGLQAGYYYWNGASWATIATASAAGNGVTATELVKLYGEVYSTATGKIANSTGYSFTVPVSGKYLFDFSSTMYANGANVSMTFYVRQGTTNLGTDTQTGWNNTAHVEYNGKIEVNLQAGVTYNVYVSSTGIRDQYDFDRVYYKMVAGNLPVTGQTVDYVSTSLSSSYASVGGGYDIVLQQKNGGNIPYNSSTGVYTLSANKTYMMQAQLRVNTGSPTNAYLVYTWVDATTNTPLVSNSEALNSSNTSGAGFGSKEVVQMIYTPTTNQTIKLRATDSSSGTQTIVLGTAVITQIGSSAIINPWVLSGNNVYNTSGKVGIGNNAPNATLDVRTSPTSTTDPGAGFIGIGTTTSTASTAGAGAVRYNTSTSKVEVSNGSTWRGAHAPMYAQFQANAQQTFYAAGGKVSFPNTIINSGGITIETNNTITLPAGRVYRVDFNMGWTNMPGAWARFAIYNAGTSTAISTPAHLEAVTNTGAYAGSGATTTFVDTTSGSIQIDVRYVVPANTTTYLGDIGSGTSFSFIVIQAVD